MRSVVRLLALSRASYRPSITPAIAFTRAMSSPPSPTGSPVHKRVRADEPAPATSGTATPVAAVKAEPSSPKRTPLIKSALPNKGKGKRKRNRHKLPDPFSSGDVLYRDVVDFLGKEYTAEVLARGDDSDWAAPENLEYLSTVELTVGAMTVSGESISMWEHEGKKWAVIVPFAHPKDKIRAKIFKHDRFCSHADLVEITELCDELRGGEGDKSVNPDKGCQYFGVCGGCQFQEVPYAKQLEHKLRTVDLAYQRFSGLAAEKVPAILPTIGSPIQWGYRTKITPHFNAVPKWARPEANVGADEEAGNEKRAAWECKIGFDKKGQPGVLDIEECVIATAVLNEKLVEERKRVKETILSYKRGATILLRDSLTAPEPLPTAESPYQASTAGEDKHIAVTDHKQVVFERVGPFLFSFNAGSFFQNNNSILIPLTEYVKEAIFPPGSTAKRPTHLVDTYCGSGLFGITLSPEFERVAGVEISADSIKFAKKNAEMNGLQDKTTWLCGKAEDIFGDLPEAGFAGDHSCVVIDPPRKGCDTPFLEQLLAFKPLTAVYVSCNVHTQARDIGWFLTESEKRGEGKWHYELESLRGFDLFPQTAHVESVGVLRLVETA